MTLKKHFTPKINTSYERYLFRQLKQEASETVEQFITRLRSKSVHCSFTNDDEAIRDQVIGRCYSRRLRMKLLEKGNDLTLDELRMIATTLGMTEFQMKAMDCGKPEEQVNRVSGTKPKTWKS